MAAEPDPLPPFKLKFSVPSEAKGLSVLVSPCCQALGFQCRCCRPPSIYSSAKTTYEHFRTDSGKALRDQHPNFPAPSAKGWETIFSWYGLECSTNQLPAVPYHEPSQQHLANGFPGIPGRTVHVGLSCSVCHVAMIAKHRNDTKHNCPGGTMQACDVMMLSKSYTVRVVGLLSPEELQKLAAYDSLFQKAMDPPEELAAPQAQAGPPPVGFEISLEAVFGPSQIHREPIQPLIPRYLSNAGWYSTVTQADVEPIIAFSAPAAASVTSADIFQVMYEQTVWCLTERIFPTAIQAPLNWRCLVNHTFQYGGHAKDRRFRECTSETRMKYARPMAAAIVAIVRFYLRDESPLLHQWTPTAHQNIKKHCLDLMTVLRSTIDSSVIGEVNLRKIECLLAEIVHCLISEAATPRLDNNPALIANLPPPLRASAGAPMLITYVCCSLLLPPGVNDSRMFFADAKRLRKLCVCVIYLVKTFCLYRLWERHYAGRLPALPEPAPNAATTLLAQVAVPLLNAGSIQGDEAANKLLVVMTGNSGLFQNAASLAKLARTHQNDDELRKACFRHLGGGLYALQYLGKVIFYESALLSRLCSTIDLAQAITAYLVLTDGFKRYLGRGGLEALIADLVCLDTGDLDQFILFDLADQSGGRHPGSKPTRESTLQLANLFTPSRELQASPGFHDDLLHHMEKIQRILSVVIPLDLVIGPRITECSSNLLAVPSGGIQRTVSVGVTGLVQLHVSSQKNDLSDVAFLSEGVSPLVRVYLAIVRPVVVQVRLVGGDIESANELMPSINEDSARRHLSAYFSKINATGILRRPGMIHPTADAMTGIGARVLRQLGHELITQLGPTEYVRQAHLLRDMLDNVLPDLQPQYFGSAFFRLFASTSLETRIVAGLAMHSEKVSVTDYGLSERLPDLPSRQIPQFRIFTCGIDTSRAETALAKLGYTVESALAELCQILGRPVDTAVLLREDLRRPRSTSSEDVADPTQETNKRRRSSAAAPSSSSAAAAAAPAAAPAAPAAAMLVDAVAGNNVLSPAVTAPAPLLAADSDTLFAVAHALDIRYGPRPFISPNQKLLTENTALGKHTLAIMPTGSGKTLALIAFALAFPSLVSLVVLPLQGLAQDMEDRLVEVLHSKERVFSFDANRMSYNRAKFLEPNGQASKIRVVLASVKDVVDHASIILDLFKELSFRFNHRLARIFVDEAHIFLGSTCYRREFGTFGANIRQYGVPIVCTTATAAPPMEAAIIAEIYGPAQLPDVAVIRDLRIKMNIRYSVVKCRNEQLAVPEFVQLMLGILINDPLWQNCQALIFARTCAQCQLLCNALQETGLFNGLLVYTSNTPDRKHVLASFKTKPATHRVMVCSEALGCGVDIKTVGVVVHYGIASISPESFSQQTGRGSRPGSEEFLRPSRGHANSVVYFVQKEYDALAKLLQPNTAAAVEAAHHRLPSPLEQAERMLKYALLSSGQCRRRYLAELNGHPEPKDCGELARDAGGVVIDVSRCDLCTAGQQSHLPAQVAAAHASEISFAAMDISARYPGAEAMFTDATCIVCSLWKGKLNKLGQCGHQDLLHMAANRCVVCNDEGHFRLACTAFSVGFGTASPQSRCYKCLRQRSRTSGGSCTYDGCKNKKLCMLFVAILALDVLQDQEAAWAHLKTQLPQELIKAATAVKAQNSQATKRELLKCLLRSSPAEEFCWAQVVVLHAAATLQ
jgi:superfamily II DNA helicase RecQ